MKLTEEQRTELAALREELHKAEARVVSALRAVPDGHALEGEPLERFEEADREVSELRDRIKEIVGEK